MDKDILIGLVLDEESSLTLDEMCHACGVQSQWVIELVDEGILEPAGNELAQWNFSGSSLHRARTVCRLQQDLGINIAGAALVLDLMDGITVLRARASLLELEG